MIASVIVHNCLPKQVLDSVTHCTWPETYMVTEWKCVHMQAWLHQWLARSRAQAVLGTLCSSLTMPQLSANSR